MRYTEKIRKKGLELLSKIKFIFPREDEGTLEKLTHRAWTDVLMKDSGFPGMKWGQNTRENERMKSYPMRDRIYFSN